MPTRRCSAASLEGWGKYGFTITATDANGYSASQAYTLTINSPLSFSVNGNAAPVLPTSSDDYIAIQDVPYFLPIVAGNGDTYTYTVTNLDKLTAAGFALTNTPTNPSIPVLSGTPNERRPRRGILRGQFSRSRRRPEPAHP